MDVPVDTLLLHPKQPWITANEDVAQYLNSLRRSSGSAMIQLNHKTFNEFSTAAAVFTQHTKSLIDCYSDLATSPLYLLVIPTNRAGLGGQGHRGAWAEFISFPSGTKLISLYWYETEPKITVPVLTHELGHYFRSFSDLNFWPDTVHRLMHHLLHEGTAEQLVREIHGSEAVHHNYSVSKNVKSNLPELFRYFLYSKSDRSDIEQLVKEFCEEDGLAQLYPAALQLSQRSGLSFRDLATTDLRDYIARIEAYVEWLI